MLQSGAPVQLITPFAQGATGSLINNVPLVPFGGQPAGQVAYSTGFTITNFTAIASGGVPPWGADMNGLLFNATEAQIYAQAGYVYPFNATFSTGVGGYPKGGRVAMTSGLGLWISTADSNTTNPDTAANAGWVAALANQGASTVSGITGGTVTLTNNELNAPLLLLTGTLTSNASVVLGLSQGASYTVQNLTTGAFTLTVGGATGSVITLTQGSANGQTVYCDGTNWYTSSFSGAGIYLPIAGTAVAASKLATARTFTFTGFATGSVSFDGSANVTCALTGGASGVTAGTYGSSTQVPQITVNSSGLVTSVTNVTVSVTSVFGRTGAVVLTAADVNGLGNLALTGTLSATGVISSPAGFSTTGAASGYLAFDRTTSLEWSLYASGGSFNIFNGTNGNMASWNVAGAMTNVGSIASIGHTFGSAAASSVTDLSKHIALYGSVNGINITSSRQNYVVAASNAHVFVVAGTDVMNVSTGSVAITGTISSTGLASFNTSDKRVKENVTPVLARPVHLLIKGDGPLCRYDRTDVEGSGLSPMAGDVRDFDPIYVGLDPQPRVVPGNDVPTRYLTLDKVGIAYEAAIYAGQETDRLRARIEALEARP